jgi:transcriptional regulator with XRE-family HTH domain
MIALLPHIQGQSRLLRTGEHGMSGAPDLTPFAILLRRHRQAAGLTQEELAERAHLSARGISDLERGLKHAPRKFTILALADALTLSGDERAALEAAARATSERTAPSVSGEAPFVFLSYAQADSAIVPALVKELQTRDVTVWADPTSRKTGAPRSELALREAVRAAQSVVLLVSPNTRNSRSVVDELRIAEIYRRDVHPVWIAGGSWEECAPGGWSAFEYVDARDDRYEQAARQLAARFTDAAQAGPATPSPARATSEPELQPRNPYKGLHAFTGEDTGDFFGRERLIQTLLSAVGGSAGETPRFLALIGPSGSGKSSLVLAGLLPRLHHGALPGSESWVYLPPLFPGDHPLESLTIALGNMLPGSSMHAIREDLDSSPRALHLLAGRLAPKPQSRVVLVVDQCEELFTLTADESERRTFIDLLASAVHEPRGPLQVILTLRADFYDRPMSYPTN